MKRNHEIEAIILANSQGITARILTLGATVQSITSPDRQGRTSDIVLGFDRLDDYRINPNYFGVTLGRFANRIAGAKFTLDGSIYRLTANDGENALHGGCIGFSRKLWSVIDRNVGEANPSVTMRLHSPDGEEGYPAKLSVSAVFELIGNALSIRYQAECDAPTLVNLSNHTYFNLGGAANDQDVLQHELMIPADSFLPVNENSIPTGEFRSVRDSPFDFRESIPIGRHIDSGLSQQIEQAQGYDHCWVFANQPTRVPRLMARLFHPHSGRLLEVLSTQPGLQFYSGNFLDDGKSGKSGCRYRKWHGLSLEPQLLPDTPNQPSFGSARLAPGELYETCIVYQLSATP